MRRITALCICFAFTTPVAKADDDAKTAELLKAGDMFIAKFPKLLKPGERDDYYEASAMGKRLGAMRMSSNISGDPLKIEYKANAVMRVPNDLTMTSEARFKMDRFAGLQSADLRQTARRADGKQIERHIEVTRTKTAFLMKTTQGKKVTQKEIELPDGRCVTITPELVSAIVASGEKKLAFHDFDPDSGSIDVRILEVHVDAGGKSKVSVTTAGESAPSETYVIGKSGRMVNYTKGLEESLRRIKRADYDTIRKEVDSKADDNEEDD